MIETGLNDIQPDSSLKTYLGDSIHLLRDAISERKAKSVIGSLELSMLAIPKRSATEDAKSGQQTPWLSMRANPCLCSSRNKSPQPNYRAIVAPL